MRVHRRFDLRRESRQVHAPREHSRAARRPPKAGLGTGRCMNFKHSLPSAPRRQRGAISTPAVQDSALHGKAARHEALGRAERHILITRSGLACGMRIHRDARRIRRGKSTGLRGDARAPAWAKLREAPRSSAKLGPAQLPFAKMWRRGTPCWPRVGRITHAPPASARIACCVGEAASLFGQWPPDRPAHKCRTLARNFAGSKKVY